MSTPAPSAHPPVVALAMGDPSGIGLELVAKLLADSFGLSAGDAIAQVRQARPGTIETAAQEDFVRGPPQFAPPAVGP